MTFSTSTLIDQYNAGDNENVAAIVRRYGQLIEDWTRDDKTGAHRYQKIKLDDLQFEIVMHNGRVTDVLLTAL